LEPDRPAHNGPCNSILDIVKAPIKFGAPLDALIGPMLAALAANPARAGRRRRRRRRSAYDHLQHRAANPETHQDIETLFSVFEAADDWEGEALFLHIRIIWMAIDAVPVEFAEFAMRTDPGITNETVGQLLFAISCSILFLSTTFTSRFKRAVLRQF
jgi:hypothetical protein